VLLLRHRWCMNKFSNFKISRRIYNHCQKLMATLILYLRSNWHVLQWSAYLFDTVF